MPERSEAAGPAARRIAQHYEVHEPLGRGGMACVYRATDLRNGREVALKQLVIPEHVKDRAGIAALFEREYHVLSQLAHPRVIEVYDYGIEPELGAFYTMELLSGGDVRELAPLPYRRACQLLFGVASSLALLHSRRLLHRDVSPRNVRCTPDGHAKLIDFGAIVPMGTSITQVVGTPVCTPPEALHRLSLDARSDLYSFGVTLYYALTRVLPFPAQSLAELPQHWTKKPAPPSAYAADIPPALDDLVLSLISPEPGLRPRNAFEVMQRLAACAELTVEESDDVASAYLATPALVGREQLRSLLRDRLSQATRSRGAALCLRGPAGAGRSRMLDVCVLEAKTLGMATLRTSVTTAEPLNAALALADLLLEALPLPAPERTFPELFEPSASPPAAPANDVRAHAPWRRAAEPKEFADALCRLFIAACRTQPLLLAVDDIQRIDAQSAAVLAQLIDRSRSLPLCVVLTADPDSTDSPLAMQVLTRRCELLPLPALSAADSHALLASVFGDVANLPLVARELHALAQGIPGLCLALAQHLLDLGKIEYRAGAWQLPAALHASDLPRHTLDALGARIARLSESARALAQAQALAFEDAFTQEDFQRLAPALPGTQLDLALTELLAAQVLSYDGRTYTLRNRLWSEALRASLSESERRERHHALAEMSRDAPQSVAHIYHLFYANRLPEALEQIILRHQQYEKSFDVRQAIDEHSGRLAQCYAIAIETARQLGKSPRAIAELHHWLAAVSVITDAGFYEQGAPFWLAQLERDSGLELWRKDAGNADAGARLMNALIGAKTRYDALPEAERVYDVQEAIRMLAEYVAFSIVIGSRTMDGALLQSLPPLLEPFAPLSPLLEAIWQNTVATCESSCLSLDSARDRWLAVLDKLATVSGVELPILEQIRNAVMFAVGLIEAEQGRDTAERWAVRIEQDPLQRQSALQLRRIARLSQGDFQSADRLRREAELWALSARAPQMFHWLIVVEMKVSSYARDLAGVAYAIDQMRPWAARYPGWLPSLHDAEGRFHAVRGDYAAAKASFEQCIELCPLDAAGLSNRMVAWISAQGGLCEALLQLGDVTGAERTASAALLTCERIGTRTRTQELTRSLALAEAKQGKFQAACLRLERMIETLGSFGVTGLRLGLALEARADVAIMCGDADAFEHYARLTAQEYRYGAGSPLGARYERLVNEARRAGLHKAPDLSEFAPTEVREADLTGTRDFRTLVLRAFAGALRVEERAKRALTLLCEVTGAATGHLYLLDEGELKHGAAHGEASAPAVLLDSAQALLTQSVDLQLTQMMTEASSGESQPPAHTSPGGHPYELWPLSFVHQATRVCVGAVALGSRERRPHQPDLVQLLPLLAAQLVDDDRTRILH